MTSGINRCKRLWIGALCLCLFAGSGCAVFKNPSTVQRIATSCKVAAFVGTSEYVRQHPESRSKFEAARDELHILATADVVDWVTLLAIVQRLPVKEVHTERATLIITAATILLSDYAGSLPLNQQAELKVFAKALEDGVALGLNQPQTQAGTLDVIL